MIIGDVHLATTKQEVDTIKEIKLDLPKVVVSMSWSSILKRFADVHLLLDSPELGLFTEKWDVNENTPGSPGGLLSPKAALEKLRPFRLNAEIWNGSIRFNNYGLKRKMELEASQINMTISDLTNQHEQKTPCEIKGNAQLYEGAMEMNISLQPLEPTLTFNLNLQIKSVNLVLLNDLVRSFGRVDVNKGILDLAAEVAVSNNAFKGYIKPVLKELEL